MMLSAKLTVYKVLWTAGIATLVLPGFQALAAEISGKVTLKGTPPPEKVLAINPSDPTCGALHKKIPNTRFFVADKSGGLADVVVYISKGVPPDKKFEPPEKPLVIDQVGCEFFPYVSAVMARQKVHVKNSDPFMHNVNFTPSVDIKKRNPNVAQMQNGPVIERAFEKQPELFVRFKCDVHPWMFAYLAVLDHPYFMVMATDGTFKIPNLPPGKYTIEAIHRKAGKLSKDITVTDSSQVVDFTFEIKP